MPVIARLTNRIARPHLPRRTVRLRMTLLYGGLFLISGAALLAVTYVLVRHSVNGPIKGSDFRPAPGGGLGPPQNSPGPSMVPAPGQPVRQGFLNILSAQTEKAVARQKSAVMHQLLINSGIALTLMSVISIVLGWIVAGRILRPLRTITVAAGHQPLAERLITNLMDNALRHNTPHGRIEVTTQTVDGHAILIVTNTGPVVPPNAIEQLFQPFQRLGTARTRRSEGLGLGLSIVQAIATADDATITTSARPDGGLTITVTFPALSNHAPPTPPQPKQTTARTRWDGQPRRPDQSMAARNRR